MESVWIIGGGRFGLRAAKYLLGQPKAFSIVFVDSDPAKLDQAKGLDCICVHADGVDYLTDHLTPDLKSDLKSDLKYGDLPDWIVPALPVHLAWEWCRRQQRTLAPLDIFSEIQHLLPNPMQGEDGDIYVSHADFICPPHCSEPLDVCTVTQKPRKLEMFKLLSRLQFKDFSSLVIQSLQLGPGVGGYRPKALFSLLEEIKAEKGPFLLSTACRCHAVITPVNPEGQRL